MGCGIKSSADGVRFIVACADDPGRPAFLQSITVFKGIGGDHTCPRFGECNFSIAFVVADFDEVVAQVTGVNIRTDDGVLRESALKPITVRQRFSIDQNVGFESQAVANLILVLQVAAHADDGHRNFMPKHDGFFLHVAQDAWMILSLRDNFDVREAKSAGIVADEQFIGSVGWGGDFDRLSILAHVFKSRTVQSPEAICLWKRRFCLAILVEFVG